MLVKLFKHSNYVRNNGVQTEMLPANPRCTRIESVFKRHMNLVRTFIGSKQIVILRLLLVFILLICTSCDPTKDKDSHHPESTEVVKARLDSLVVTLRTTSRLVPTDVDPMVSGDFVYWCTGDCYQYFRYPSSPEDEHIYSGKTGGFMRNELNIGGYDYRKIRGALDYTKAHKAKTLVLVESDCAQSQSYRVTSTTTTTQLRIPMASDLPAHSSTQYVPFGSTTTISTYNLHVWLVDLATGTITGYREFPPPRKLMESESSRSGGAIANSQERALAEWVEELYKKRRK